MITTPTIGTTVLFAGIYAEPEVWQALGAQEAYACSNQDYGTIRWSSLAGSRMPTDADARMLIETARDQLGESATDAQVLRRAIALRYATTNTVALRALADAMRGGVRVTGSVPGLEASLDTLAGAVALAARAKEEV